MQTSGGAKVGVKIALIIRNKTIDMLGFNILLIPFNSENTHNSQFQIESNESNPKSGGSSELQKYKPTLHNISADCFLLV